MKKYFEDLITKHNELEEHIYATASTMAKLDGRRLEPYEFDRFYVDGGKIWIEFQSCALGYCETDEIVFPTEYLWDENWEATYQAEKMRKNIEALKEREKKEAEEQRRKEFNERETYLKLKEKYDE